MSEKTVEQLYDEILDAGLDDGKLQKKADHPDGEEVANKIEGAKDGGQPNKGYTPEQSGEDYSGMNGAEAKTGKVQDPAGTMEQDEVPSTTKVQKEQGKPMAEQVKEAHSNNQSGNPDQNNGEDKNQANTAETKTATEENVDVLIKSASILEELDPHIKDRFQSEELLKKGAEEVINSIKEDVQALQQQQGVDQLSSLITERHSKKAAEYPEKDKKQEDNKGQSDNKESEKTDTSKTENSAKDQEDKAVESAEDSESKKDSPVADSTDETPEGGDQTEGGTGEVAGERESSEPSAVTSGGVEEAPAGGMEESGMVPMEQLPVEAQEQLQSLISDISAKTGLPEETVLEELNAVSDEVMGQMDPEQLVGDMNKAAHESRAIQLIDELDKLSAEITGDEEAPVEEAATEAVSEPEAASEAAEAMTGEGSGEGDEEAMAQSYLQELSQEEIDALSQAVEDLESQGVPEEMIEDAVKSVLSGDVSEDVTKVSSEDDFAQLKPKDQVVTYMLSSYYNNMNDTQNQNQSQN